MSKLTSEVKLESELKCIITLPRKETGSENVKGLGLQIEDTINWYSFKDTKKKYFIFRAVLGS